MKAVRFIVGLILLVAVAGGVFVLLRHSEWFKSSAHEDEEKEAPTDVPVKTAHVEKATLRGYVEGFGIIQPQPAASGKAGAGVTVTSPVAGVVSAVYCEAGKAVEEGAPLFQLDDRIAKAAEEQAAAVLVSAQAGLAKLKATPRPEQLELAQLVVDKARSNVDFTQKSLERQKQLLESNNASQKAVEAAQLELVAAQNDLKVAQKQLAILKATPTPEELAEENAKVAEAQKALLAAQLQRSLLKIQSPIAGTVVRINVNVGEAVDSTKVLGQVVALNRLIAAVNVPATEAASVKIGQPAEISSELSSKNRSNHSPTIHSTTKPSADAADFAGTVQLVTPIVDQKSDSVVVEVRLKPDMGFQPGQAVRVRIIVDVHNNVLVVPTESVITNGEGESVVAVVKDDKAVQVPVHV
ncbi:MAG TPA: HlyD family efflux transporter periplasmic adaptor subunit, partial [Tepidisphaeraceae bacterium]|nr:HlyD family efflux transporter periplasmic adaptor subunit [Tepidisphaeraceae bacterium]